MRFFASGSGLHHRHGDQRARERQQGNRDDRDVHLSLAAHADRSRARQFGEQGVLFRDFFARRGDRGYPGLRRHRRCRLRRERSKGSEAHLSPHGEDNQNRRNDCERRKRGKDGNLGVSYEDPDDQRRVEQDHQHRQQAQKQARLLFGRLAVPPALRAIRFAHGARRGHVTLRTFGGRHGVTIFRLCAAAQNPSYDVAMAALIELRGLTVELPTPSGWIRPVDDVSFALETGESLGLVGESGSGKSMLALALMGLLPPGARIHGEAWLAGANGSGSSRVNLLTLPERERVATRGRDIAMIFQEPMTALNPVMRAGAQIAEAIRAHHAGLSREEVNHQVLAALERAAVPEPELRARQYPHQLSGGLRQRVMIAMALAGGAGGDARESSRDRGRTAPLACSSLTSPRRPSTSPCRNKFSSCWRACGVILALRFYLSHTTSEWSRRWRIASRSPTPAALWKKALRAKCWSVRNTLIQPGFCALLRNWRGGSSSRSPEPCRHSPRCPRAARLSRVARCVAPNALPQCLNCAPPVRSTARAASSSKRNWRRLSDDFRNETR